MLPWLLCYITAMLHSNHLHSCYGFYQTSILFFLKVLGSDPLQNDEFESNSNLVFLKLRQQPVNKYFPFLRVAHLSQKKVFFFPFFLIMIPFYAEELSNINVLRASISVDNNIDVADSLCVKNNIVSLKDQVVVDLSKVNVDISTENLVIAQASNDNKEDDLVPWEIKFNLTKSKKTLQSQQADVKDWWTSKTLLNGETTSKKEIQCQHCSCSILDSFIEYKIKDLPSEHWYELVECWICHETKPEEHRARMRPILARPDLLLVGTTYFLIHPQNIVQDSVQVDHTVLERTNVSNHSLYYKTNTKRISRRLAMLLDIIINRYKNPRLPLF